MALDERAEYFKANWDVLAADGLADVAIRLHRMDRWKFEPALAERLDRHARAYARRLP